MLPSLDGSMIEARFLISQFDAWIVMLSLPDAVKRRCLRFSLESRYPTHSSWCDRQRVLPCSNTYVHTSLAWQRLRSSCNCFDSLPVTTGQLLTIYWHTEESANLTLRTFLSGSDPSCSCDKTIERPDAKILEHTKSSERTRRTRKLLCLESWGWLKERDAFILLTQRIC